MSEKIALFWPGDYRAKPNEWALPSITGATEQLERALTKLGRQAYRVPGFLTKPHEAIEKLGPIDDPLIGVCVHWFYGPHTTDGVVGKKNPLLLASNFSGQWPGLVGLLNTGACLESVGREFSRIWTDSADWTTDDAFMQRLAEWCSTGRISYPTDALGSTVAITPAAAEIGRRVAAEIRKRRILALMLGDTSMGMINGYFGHRVLNRIGFTEHKVDQAWIIERGRGIAAKRIDAAFSFVREKGVTFHWRGENCPASIAADGADFTEDATREQLRDYLAVLDLVDEFKADCIGWQYQLGLWPLRPPSDFNEGLLNSVCRPESNGDLLITSTEADQGNLVPMELMKRVLKAKGLHQAVMFHDVRWGAPIDEKLEVCDAQRARRFVWVLLNSGSCGAYAFNHDPNSLRGVHSYRQPAGYFPIPGGTFAGESLPGAITWSRAWLCGESGQVVMDLGRGEVLKLPAATRDKLWEGTTRQWPFMAADLGVGRDAVMAHYMSNHIAVSYGDILGELAALCSELGIRYRVWGKQ